MDYNKIQTFVVAASLGSLTAAGRQLQRSQSAISQQIQGLEDELELRLFERKAGKILLSADGERLYRIAKDRLAQIADEIASLQKQIKNIDGHIRIGVLDDAANEFEIGPYLANLCTKNPRISIAISYGTSESLELDLIENRIDLGCLVFFKNSELFIRRPISSTRHNLYTSTAYLKSHGPIKNYANVAEAHLLDLHEDFTTLVPWFRKNSPNLVSKLKHRKPNLLAPNHKTLKQIVMSGYGIAILPDYLMANEIKRGTCVQVMSSSKAITSGLDLAYRTNKTLRLCEKLLINEIPKI